MQRLVPLVLLGAGMLAACSGQGTFSFDVKANTPTAIPAQAAAPTAIKTSTTAAGTSTTPVAEAEEQPPSPGGKETSAEKLSPEIALVIQTQVAGLTMAGAPRAFIIPQAENQVEVQYTQQLNSRGWQQVSSSAGLTGKVKVMVMQKGKMKAHVIFASQSNTETAVYILTTRG